MNKVTPADRQRAAELASCFRRDAANFREQHPGSVTFEAYALNADLVATALERLASSDPTDAEILRVVRSVRDGTMESVAHKIGLAAFLALDRKNSTYNAAGKAICGEIIRLAEQSAEKGPQ